MAGAERRTRKTGLLASVRAIARYAVPAVAACAPTQIVMAATPEGWGPARWDMDAAELRSAFSGGLTVLPTPLKYGGASASLILKDVALGGVPFTAVFQMNEANGRLQQVLLQSRNEAARAVDFAAAIDALTASYGPPDLRCRPDLPGAPPTVAELRWTLPTLTIHASLLDLNSRFLLYDTPNKDLDPLDPAGVRIAAMRRSLPKRLLVRFHPAERTDLIAATACVPYRR